VLVRSFQLLEDTIADAQRESPAYLWLTFLGGRFGADDDLVVHDLEVSKDQLELGAASASARYAD